MFKPIGDKLSVRRLAAEEKSAGGIILPLKDKKKTQEGIVLELGEGKLIDGERHPYPVKKGDHIIFSHTSGTRVKVDNEEILVLSQDEILAVVE